MGDEGRGYIPQFIISNPSTLSFCILPLIIRVFFTIYPSFIDSHSESQPQPKGRHLFNITKFRGQHRTFVISQPVGWENILNQHLTNILWVLRDLMDWKTDSRTYSLVGRDKIITHMKGKYVMVKGRRELVTFNAICILLFMTAPPPCTFKIVAFICTSISFIQTTFGIILQAPKQLNFCPRLEIFTLSDGCVPI